MKIGDLVRCIWQPGCSHYDREKKCVVPMKYIIKGKIGIITKINDKLNWYYISFPQFYGYTHTLHPTTFEILK